MSSMKTMLLSEHGLGWAVPNSRGLLLHIIANDHHHSLS